MKEKQQLLFRNSGSTGSDWLVAGTLDEFLQNGVYLIKMLNADGTLGLPFSVTNDDVVKLVVSDSGANGRQQTGRAVVQTITFARSGSAMSITYTRTRRNVNGNHQWSSWVEPEAASTVNIYDGSVTAEKLSDDIRPNVVNPLRPLFIAAGAEYNDSSVGKTKKAPWGETVIHKAGHYYLNGLGDITEEQMLAIYRIGNGRVYEKGSLANYISSSVRTNFPASVDVNLVDTSKAVNCENVAANNTYLEIVKFSNNAVAAISQFNYGFYKCKKLFCIDNELILTAASNEKVTNAFYGCSACCTCGS